MADIHEISEFLQKGRAKNVKALVEEALAEGQDPKVILNDGLLAGMMVIGEKFKNNEVFVPEVLVAARALNAGLAILEPKLIEVGNEPVGKVVIGTVKGDLHDIGKNLVAMMMKGVGFEVIDLGRDVPVETVVDTVREKDVHLVGLSALMTTTLKSMEETIAALHAAKLDCKIMVGGAVLTPEYAEKIGADWYAKDAKRSADIAKEFFGV